MGLSNKCEKGWLLGRLVYLADDSLELKKKNATYISLTKVVFCRILTDHLVMTLYENSIIM